MATPPRRSLPWAIARASLAAGALLQSSVVATNVEAQQAPPPAQGETTLRPGQFVQSNKTAASATSSVDFETKDEFSAAYIAADVTFVIDEMLGHFLKIDYSVAPDVSGRITMRVDHIKSRLAAVNALRTALRPLGIALIDRGDFVAITRATTSGQDGPAHGVAISPGETVPPGANVAVITPKHVAPSRLGPLIAPFSPAANISLTDDTRRVLIVKGDESAINAASSAAAMFDVDWFAQVSTASFTLKNIGPLDLIAELKPLLGPTADAVDLIPIPRLQRVVVLARSPEPIGVIKEWVAKLDVPSADISANILIYHAKYVGADTLAASLRDAGGDGGTSSSGPSSSPSSSASPTASFGSQANGSASTGPGISAPAGAQRPATSPAPNGGQSASGGASASRTSGNLSVSANLGQNIVIVRGDADQLAEAKILLDALDQQPAQVLIQAAVVEVTLTNDLQYGVTWSGVQNKFSTTFTDDPGGKVTSTFPGFSLTYVNSGIEAALNLLSSVTKVEVLSRPSVLALQNETASLQVGDEVPIVTQSAVSVVNPDAPIVNQTTYRDTGVILKVVPHVRAGGLVDLEVDQEVSQVAKTTTSGIDSPTIQQRKVSSRLLVPSGESVAIGGLISANKTSTVVGIPILKDIPLLGQIFRTDSKSVNRTEMIVFLTPKILVDGRAAVSATDQLRASFYKLERDLEQ